MTRRYAWFKLENGREVYRPVPDARNSTSHARSDLPCPLIKSDRIEPIRGFDGKMYDSLSGFRKTLLPSGNPQGERYYELGDQEIKFQAPKFDRAKRREDIKRAIADVESGNVPTPVYESQLP